MNIRERNGAREENKNNPRVKRDHRSEPQLENAEGYTISDQMRRERETTWTHVHTHVGQLYTQTHRPTSYIYMYTRPVQLAVCEYTSISLYLVMHAREQLTAHRTPNRGRLYQSDQIAHVSPCVVSLFDSLLRLRHSLSTVQTILVKGKMERDIICWWKERGEKKAQITLCWETVCRWMLLLVTAQCVCVCI